jgi:hypothetical protein
MTQAGGESGRDTLGFGINGASGDVMGGASMHVFVWGNIVRVFLQWRSNS